MAAVEVPQTLEYKGGQLNVAPVLEVENFTNWKKRFMCHIVGIEPQFENIISNGPYIPMAAGQRKPETQWTPEERKAANLDQRLKSLIINTNHVKDFELASLFGKLKYEENLINSIYETEKSKSLVSATALSTTFFSASIVQDFQDNPDDEEDTRSNHDYLKDLDTLAPSSSSGKNKGLIAETYDWDEEEVSSDENKVTEKALMALSNEEIISVSKESASNGEWVKISIQKVHTLLEMEDNDDRKSFLDYMCIDLNYVEEQRNNLMSKHRNLVQELNTCKEQLLVLKQAMLDFLTMQHVNTEILKENQNLRNELKEITSITEAWLNSSNKVNQCISEQIPTQKRKILGIDQLTKDTSRFRPKDLVFVKCSVDNSEVSITSSNKPKLYETEDSTMSNYDTAPLPLPEKLIGAELVFGPKTIKSILKSKSTFKAETLKGITINEPSSAARGNKSPSVSKTNSPPVSKLKNVKIEDDPP
ncbi:hypothetical protein Tco_0573168 [Tanacetum coccineum]